MNLDDINGADILALPMEENDAGATTVKAYLIALLSRVWKLNEGFSGKRPFGNSSWQNELYEPLAKAGLVESDIEDGRHYAKYEKANRELAHALIFKAIEAL